MNVLVVGAGSIGTRHLSNLINNKKKLLIASIAVCETSADKRAITEKQFKVPMHSTLSRALSEKPRIVIVATPSASHLNVATRAAETGAHIFVEKPLSHQTSGVSRLISSLKKNQKLMVGCNMRFQPSVKSIKQLIEKNRIGKIIAARAQSGHYLPDWRPQSDYSKSYSAQKNGGGALLDCIQIFDCFRWFLGEAKAISCFLKKGSSLKIKSEDVAQVLIDFKSGTLGAVHVDYVQRYQEKTLHLIGENGTLLWQWSLKKLMLFDGEKKLWQEYPEPKGYDFNQSYVEEIQHFFDSVRLNTPLIQKPEVAWDLLRWIDAAKTSSRTGKSVVLQK
ncbi:MAG: Gfo/Idh/MocA family oxidoreductase [Candidatus Omnitrophica bacterium]|nr:Gfo/Idh/MocA family oxidoreductase [Candidatus Omnitrophota bacterium]